MADAEQRRPEVEQVEEAGLKAIAMGEALPDNGIEAVISPKEVVDGNGAHVDDILEFDDIGAKYDGTTEGSNSSVSQVETGESSRNVGEVVEEEIVELEFEKVKPKLATHSMHCPNCKSEITKVVLRRKVLAYHRPDPVVPEPEPQGLLGCLSCLSLFTCSDDGCFNPFNIFKRRPATGTASPPSDGENATPMLKENESCFSMFWVIRKGNSNQKPEDPRQPESLEANPQAIISDDQVQQPLILNPESIITPAQVKSHSLVAGHTSIVKDSTKAPSSSIVETRSVNNATIDIENAGETLVAAQPRGRPWLGSDGILLEILKSIVYGGLMEVIASLSIVASAAASDAATLSIISLALASLAGGVFVIGNNLWDLKDDCYKNNSQESNNEATTKYKELLGQVNYFPLHAFFAILSFLVFGMVPPIAYGYSLYETNDKDFTVSVVAIVSLVCVSLLAIFKAYINKCTFFEYLKTVVYYITTAVSTSGVSYVAGNLFMRLIEEYGFFDTSSGGGMSLLPDAAISSLASF